MIKGLDKLGLTGIKEVFRNLSYAQIHEHEIENNEGIVSDNGTFIVDTGIFTGRSPKDKYFVDQSPSNGNIAWGSVCTFHRRGHQRRNRSPCLPGAQQLFGHDDGLAGL